jgi:aminoglycoside 2''-phosphotransferase
VSSGAAAPSFAELAQGQVDLAYLTGLIRSAFPALGIEHARLDDTGEDHAVVIAGEAWVFRFPRSAKAAACAAGERRLLRGLAAVTPIGLPRCELISPAGDFAGYRMIAGAPLTPSRFARLPLAAQERALDEIGAFLAALHALPPELLTVDGLERRFQTGADYARRWAERRNVLAPLLGPALARRADTFYAALPGAVRSRSRRLIHGDLSDDHLLIDGERLAGVIDFTDARIGDPAFDFTFLWAYGEAAPARAIAAYGRERAGLAERSRWWFARYLLDQLWWAARGFRPYDVGAIRAGLARHFTALGV